MRYIKEIARITLKASTVPTDITATVTVTGIMKWILYFKNTGG